MSKAPSDWREIACALLNTSVNQASTATGSLLFTLAMMELGLKGLSERLKRCNSWSMESVKSWLDSYLIW